MCLISGLTTWYWIVNHGTWLWGRLPVPLSSKSPAVLCLRWVPTRLPPPPHQVSVFTGVGITWVLFKQPYGYSILRCFLLFPGDVIARPTSHPSSLSLGCRSSAVDVPVGAGTPWPAVLCIYSRSFLCWYPSVAKKLLRWGVRATLIRKIWLANQSL